jgi:flagellar basal body P-ring formation protein FlgA
VTAVRLATLRVAAALVLAVPVLCAAVSGGDTVRIELHPLVQAAGADVTLGEVAAVTSAQLGLVKKLVDLPLGPAPRVGESARISRVELARWVQVRTGLRAEQVEWSGPAQAEIRRVAAELPGDRLAVVASDALRASLAARNAQADIQLAAVPRDVALPAGQLVVKARAIAADQPILRRTSVWVDLWVDGRFVRTVPVGFDVAGVVAAATATSIATATATPTPLITTAAPVPVRAPISAVAVRTGVARGDWVALQVRSGGMDLESRAEALQGGAVGQMVSVRLRGATGTLEARVLAPGRVEISQ